MVKLSAELSPVGKNLGISAHQRIEHDFFVIFRRWLTSASSGIMKMALWQVWRWDPLAEVRLQEGEPLENALRRFKRKVQQEDIIKEVKRHSYYLKPGEKRRVKAALARKRNRKKARKEQD